MPSQDADAERVDRGDLGLLVPLYFEQLAGPGEHLLGRLVGERNGEDSRGTGAPPNKVGDAGDDDAGLAGAGAGEHQQRSDRRLHGLGLRGI